jgi:serine/threonine protein kinase
METLGGFPNLPAMVRGQQSRPLHHAIPFLPDGDLDQVKLIDFGIAQRTQDAWQITRPGTAVGTPLYMPPEQFREDSNVDARADVFSLGCGNLLEMLLRKRSPKCKDLTIQSDLATVNLVADEELQRRFAIRYCRPGASAWRSALAADSRPSRSERRQSEVGGVGEGKIIRAIRCKVEIANGVERHL